MNQDDTQRKSISQLVELLGLHKHSTLRVGFTGPRISMQEEQRRSLEELLQSLACVESAHHGDCVGADTEFHEICLQLQMPVVVHPPKKAEFRSYCQGYSQTHKEKGFLVRNKAIVESVDLLVAAPRSAQEVQRSGIWSTIRHARKTQTMVLLVLPNGQINRDEAAS